MRPSWLAGLLILTLVLPAAIAGPAAAADFVTPNDRVSSALSIRSGPGTNHGRVGALELGARLEKLPGEGEWLAVVLPDGGTGYVAAAFVDVIPGEAEEPTAESPLQVAVADGPIDPAAARGYMQVLTRTGSEILQQPGLSDTDRSDALAEMLAEAFALSSLGPFALGSYYNELSGDQRALYLDTYAAYLRSTFLERMAEFGDWAFDIGEATRFGDGDALVATNIRDSAGVPLRVGWRIGARDGFLRVLDIQSEGVSVAVTQRAEFRSQYKRKGFDGLIESMRAKINSAG